MSAYDYYNIIVTGLLYRLAVSITNNGWSIVLSTVFFFIFLMWLCRSLKSALMQGKVLLAVVLSFYIAIVLTMALSLLFLK